MKKSIKENKIQVVIEDKYNHKIYRWINMHDICPSIGDWVRNAKEFNMKSVKFNFGNKEN